MVLKIGEFFTRNKSWANALQRGFQPMGHGPVVGHSGFFSGPWSINQNESNMYNIYV